LSPRWEAAGIERAEVSVGYAASGAAVAYRYRREGARVALEIEAADSRVDWHVLLPAGHRAARARLDGRQAELRNAVVESSPYADGSCRVEGRARIEIDITQD
jgi:hypothetical protein